MYYQIKSGPHSGREVEPGDIVLPNPTQSGLFVTYEWRVDGYYKKPNAAPVDVSEELGSIEDCLESIRDSNRSLKNVVALIDDLDCDVERDLEEQMDNIDEQCDDALRELKIVQDSLGREE